MQLSHKSNTHLIKIFIFIHYVHRTYTQADGKKHPIPVGDKVTHYVPWNKEMDLTDYYTEMDKQFY